MREREHARCENVNILENLPSLIVGSKDNNVFSLFPLFRCVSESPRTEIETSRIFGKTFCQRYQRSYRKLRTVSFDCQYLSLGDYDKDLGNYI